MKLELLQPLEINNLDQVVEKVRKCQLKDRIVFDKSNKAFVSYIQAYSKHECHLLLRIKGNFIINQYITHKMTKPA